MINNIDSAKKLVNKKYPNFKIKSGYESSFGDKRTYAFSGEDTSISYPKNAMVLENGSIVFIEGPTAIAYLKSKKTKKVF